jgi:5-methylcytosine-specific restriction enzyme B
MASRINSRDLSPIINAAQMWMNNCLEKDGSAFFPGQSLWTESLVNEAAESFIDHPDVGGDDFMTKLKNQMLPASEPAQKLMAEMLWALLLFPSNMKARTKRQQIRDVWSLSGHQLAPDHALLSDTVLQGIGSGGPGFNNYRPHELGFLIELRRQSDCYLASSEFH